MSIKPHEKFNEYPKLEELCKMKNEINAKRAHPV